MITDYKGDEYQRIEYTPYGETWIERTDNRGLEYLPYKFSAKERDEETGLYYYGARYLDPKYSTWISTDPALGEYIPGAGKGNSKDAGSLPGMGGAYNHINFNLYHYAGNNPVKYVDPDGRTNYIFYDPESFSNQANAEADRIPIDMEKKNIKINVSGGGYYEKTISVQEKTVMIPITTEAEFVDAWNNMENPTDVSLFFHGSPTTLNINWKNNEYLTTNQDGETPLGNPATFIGKLKSQEIGCLKIYSCQGGNVKESNNVANCFNSYNTINSIYATDGNLSFTRFSYNPKISNKGKSEYKEKYSQDPQGFIKVK